MQLCCCQTKVPTSFQRERGERLLSGRPGLEDFPHHSCATAPDFHRFRLEAFPSGEQGTQEALIQLSIRF